MTERTFPLRSVIVSGTLIFAGFGLALAAGLPGHLSYDSVLQLLQGRTGIYNTWHPPVMAWLLGIGDALIPGTALFVLFDSILFFGAFLSLLVFTPHKPVWPSVCIALLCILSPQLLLYQGLVWKDVLFADAGVAAFACLALVARVWPKSGQRMAALSLSVVLLGLAALARQNGLILIPIWSTALGWIAAQQTGRVRTGVVTGSAVFVATGLLVLAATLALNVRSNGDSGPHEQLTLLQVYDLSGAVAAEPGLPLPHLAHDEPALERIIRSQGAALYTPVRIDPLTDSPALQTVLRTADSGPISAEWQALVTGHTWLYLKQRALVFWWVLATPDIVVCRPIFVGIDGPAAEMKTLGLAPRRNALDLALAKYGMMFEGTPILSHLFFAAVAALSLGLLVRRRRPEDIAIAALLAGAFAFSASFFVISISCDYRYLYFLDLATLVALFYLSLDLRSFFKAST
jgi:hypothetical protein